MDGQAQLGKNEEHQNIEVLELGDRLKFGEGRLSGVASDLGQLALWGVQSTGQRVQRESNRPT